METGLKGRGVLVTGGSDGIGKAIAMAFAKEGARIAICAREGSRLADAARDIENVSEYPVVAIQADVTVVTDIDRLADTIAADIGDLHVLVNNAGGPKPGRFEDIDDQDWQAAFELTHLSAVRVTRKFLNQMRRQRWGRIINISSYSIKQPIPGLMLSNSLRLTNMGWAKTLAGEVGTDNVLVNTICPGWTRTQRALAVLKHRAGSEKRTLEDMESNLARSIPLGRLAEPHEVAGLAVFLASDAASYITGNAIQVDGGYTGSTF